MIIIVVSIAAFIFGWCIAPYIESIFRRIRDRIFRRNR